LLKLILQLRESLEDQEVKNKILEWKQAFDERARTKGAIGYVHKNNQFTEAALAFAKAEGRYADCMREYLNAYAGYRNTVHVFNVLRLKCAEICLQELDIRVEVYVPSFGE